MKHRSLIKLLAWIIQTSMKHRSLIKLPAWIIHTILLLVKKLNTELNVRKYNMKVNTLCQLFYSSVGATLNYRCEITGFSKSKQIERVHPKFMKQILHVKQLTSSVCIYVEIGKYPIYIARYYRMITYWCKVVATDNVIISRLYISNNAYSLFKML